MTRNLRRAAVAALAGTALAAPAPAHADTTYADTVLADSPLIYLRAGESPPTTIAKDASPHHRDGTYVGAPQLGVAGPFTGAGTAVMLAAADTVTAPVPAASGSVELWVAPDRIARGQQAGIAAHGDPAGDGWALGIGAKRKLAWVTGGVTLTSRVSLATGVWTQLTLTWTGSKLELYRNGALAKSINRTGAVPASTGGALVLGGNGAGAFTGGFTGRLDEVALYGGPLAPDEVEEHFAGAHVPVNTALPRVTGKAAVGQTLTVLGGNWSPSGTATYQWQRCDANAEDCEDITGAVSTTYTVVAADACGTLQVVETVTSGAEQGTAISDPTAVVPGSCAVGPGHPAPADPAPGTIVGAGPAPAPATDTSDPAGSPAATPAGCLKLAAGRRTAKLRRVGALRVRATDAACLATPLRAAFKARRGVTLRSVRYKLDGKRLKRTRGAARVPVAALTAGTHTLVVRVKPRDKAARRVRLQLRVVTG